MVAFSYTEGIQLTAAHSGGRYSDLTHKYIHKSFVKTTQRETLFMIFDLDLLNILGEGYFMAQLVEFLICG